MSQPFSTAGELYFGDIHVHSAVSRCTGPKADADPDDMCLFARSAAGLDFFALTDHDNDLMVEGRWERAKQVADRFNEPGRFVALYAYEWTSWPHGHLNVYYLDKDAPLLLCADSGDARDPNGHTPAELWSTLRRGGIEALTLPHHVGVTMFRTNWDYYDPEFQPVAEIASLWGHFECYGNLPPVISSDTLPGYFYQDALERGYRLGAICGSDCHDGRFAVPTVHWRNGIAGRGLAGNRTIVGRVGNPLGVQPEALIESFNRGSLGGPRGITAVYAPELTREAIFRAIQTRRCYGTTGARIMLDLTLNGHAMGEMVTLHDPSSSVCLRARVRGTDLLEQVEIIKNGQLVYRQTPGESLAAEVQWTDPIVSQPDNYYYVRVRQVDGQQAWSSPIWVSWACYEQMPGRPAHYVDWPALLAKFHRQVPPEPDRPGQGAAVAIWQMSLSQDATRLCVRWRGAHGEACAGRLHLPPGSPYRLRDRNLSIERFGADLFTDDLHGAVRWHAACGPAWRGIDVAVPTARGGDVTVILEQVPSGATLWLDGRERHPGPVTFQLGC